MTKVRTFAGVLEELEAVKAELNAALEREQALAAHVELAIEALEHRPSLQSSHVSRLLDYLRKADKSCLTKRDLIKQAEAAESVAAKFADKAAKARAASRLLDTSMHNISARIANDVADGYRQRAQQIGDVSQ